MKRALWLLKWVGWVLARQFRLLLAMSTPVWLLLMLFVGVHLLSSTSHFRAGLIWFLDEQLPGRVTFEAFTWSADLQNLTFHDVKVSEGGESVLEIDTLGINVDLKHALIWGELRVSSALIDGAEGNLIFDKQGGLNISDAFKPGPGQMTLGVEEESGGPPMLFEDVDLRRANVTLNFPEFTLELVQVEVENYSLDLRGDLTMTAESLRSRVLKTTFKPEMFTFPSLPDPDSPGVLALDLLDVELEGWAWEEDGFTLARGEFSGNEGELLRVRESGLKLTEDGFDYNANLHVKAPPGWALLDYFLKGRAIEAPFELNLSARGHLGAEMNVGSRNDAKLSATLDALNVMGMAFDGGRVAAHLVNRRLYLTELVLEGYGGRVELPGDVRGPLPTDVTGLKNSPLVEDRASFNLLDQDYSIALEIEGLMLREMLSSLTPPLSAEVLNELTGELSGELSAEGRLLPGEEPERFRSVPEYHRVNVQQLTLRRMKPTGKLPARELSVKGEFRLEEQDIEGLSLLELGLDGDRVTLEGLRLSLGEESLPIEVEVSVRLGAIERYLKGFGVKGIEGRVNSKFRVGGGLMHPEVEDGVLTMESPTAFGLRGESLSVGFELLEGTLMFGPLRANAPLVKGKFGDARGRGEVRLFEGDLSAVLAEPELDIKISSVRGDLEVLSRELGLGLPMFGEVKAETLRVRGKPSRLEIGGKFTSEAVKVYGETLKGLSGELSMTKGGVEVRALSFRHGRRGRVGGDMSWGWEGNLVSHLSLSRVDLGQLNVLQGQSVRGMLKHADLEVKGRLDLKALRRSGEAGGLKWLTTQPLDIEGSVGLWDLELGTQRLGSVALNIKTLKGRVLGKADYEMDACRGEQVLMLDAIWLPRVSPNGRKTLIEASSLEAGNPLLSESSSPTGYKSVRRAFPAYSNLKVCVPMSRPEAEIEAKLVMEELNIRGVAAGLLEREMEIQRAGQELAAALEMKLFSMASAASNEKVGYGKTMTQLPLERLLQIWNATTFSGNVELKLNRETLSYIANLEGRSLAVKVLGDTFSNPRPVKVSVTGDLGGESMFEKVELEQVSIGKRQAISVRGEIRPGKMDVSVGGALDMTLANLMPQYVTDVKGILEVDLKFLDEGDGGVVPGGWVKVREPVSFRVRSLNREVTLRSGEVKITKELMTFEGLEADLLDGEAKITGGVSHNNFVPGEVRVEIESQNMTYRVPGAMNMTFNANMSLIAGDLSDFGTWSMGGEIELSGGKFYQNIDVLQSLAESSIGGTLGTGRQQKYEKSIVERLMLLEGLRLGGSAFKPNSMWSRGVKITGEDSFFVENEVQGVLVDIELQTDLEVSGELSAGLKALKMNGTVETLPGGRITFQNEDFNVSEGLVDWTGELVNPKLLLVSEVEIISACSSSSISEPDSEISGLEAGDETQAYNIVMRLEGELSDLEKLEVEFLSVPYADRRDVTMLILTGCTADQFSGGVAGKPAAALALASFYNQIEKQIKTRIQLDDIKFVGDAEVAKLHLGQQVSNRLKVGFDAEFQEGVSTSEQVGYIHILILDNVFLEVGARKEISGSFASQGRLKLRIPLD